MIAGYFLYAAECFLYVAENFFVSRDTSFYVAGCFFYVAGYFSSVVGYIFATRKHENEVEWLSTKRETPFQLPSQRLKCSFKCSQLAVGL